MNNDRDKVYIKDILEVIFEVENFTKSMTYQDFLNNRAVYRAVERDFEIIGEAVKRLSEGFKQKYPDIPWKDIAGFRDVLAHDYTAVNALTVWETLEGDMLNLKKILLKASA